MKIAILGVAALLLLAAPLVGADFSTARLAVESSIEPADGETFLCTVEVTDFATGETLAAPKIRFRSGDEAVIKIGSERDGEQLQVTVVADGARGYAILRVSVLRGESETPIQRVRFRLR